MNQFIQEKNIYTALELKQVPHRTNNKCFEGENV